ncbi:unnamed protein product [Rotaria sp. Silwood2]|nr:unnamed protein product [Rotaria sp. Silwood2]CAF2962220.1 unnamed protein product [Rotaria sp. Silwood2]CAF3400607.1 unnamed protein product [Rotaria sp. Silwood2]CAF4082206.1 unnamed protein product [Rotaria sp. Silwood2]CAF4208722.1 unnamed protein product [Rotaria sp. Silwood2]
MASALPKNKSTSLTKKTVWSWQSNSDPWNVKEKKEWQRYSDLTNEFIEKRFQSGKREVQLDQFVIDFKHMVQMRKDDKYRQRPVKKEVIEIENHLREERFCYPEKPNKPKSFGSGSNRSPTFVSQWDKSIEDRTIPLSAIVEKACKGILKEGESIGQKFEAQMIADRLNSVKNESKDEIYKCCIQLYSMESFLYKLVNSTLRNEDMSKFDSLGPYCWLLCNYIRDCGIQDESPIAVYRGCTLTDETIKQYE